MCRKLRLPLSYALRLFRLFVLCYSSTLNSQFFLLSSCRAYSFNLANRTHSGVPWHCTGVEVCGAWAYILQTSEGAVLLHDILLIIYPSHNNFAPLTFSRDPWRSTAATLPASWRKSTRWQCGRSLTPSFLKAASIPLICFSCPELEGRCARGDQPTSLSLWRRKSRWGMRRHAGTSSWKLILCIWKKKRFAPCFAASFWELTKKSRKERSLNWTVTWSRLSDLSIQFRSNPLPKRWARP